MPRFARGKLMWTKLHWVCLLLLATVISFLAALFVVLSLSQYQWKPVAANNGVQYGECLRHVFQGIVLVIVYNHPLYSSLPLLTRVYSPAFSTIMFCGPKPDNEDLNPGVEYIYHHKGYFGYMCLARAMEKYQHTTTSTAQISSYHGYLLISDDVMFNFWNFVNFDQRRLWEGTKVPIQYSGFKPNGSWYWWRSTWGLAQCQKAYNEIWSFRKVQDSWPSMHVKHVLDVLTKNGHGQRQCYRGRSDVVYIPGRFCEIFEFLSHTFYKHRVFLEIAVPTILRMLDLQENFEYIPGIYLPGRATDTFVKDSKYFRQVYSTEQYFVHPMKLNYEDADLNKDFVETNILEYVSMASNC